MIQKKMSEGIFIDGRETFSEAFAENGEEINKEMRKSLLRFENVQIMGSVLGLDFRRE